MVERAAELWPILRGIADPEGAAKQAEPDLRYAQLRTAARGLLHLALSDSNAPTSPHWQAARGNLMDALKALS